MRMPEDFAVNQYWWKRDSAPNVTFFLEGFLASCSTKVSFSYFSCPLSRLEMAASACPIFWDCCLREGSIKSHLPSSPPSIILALVSRGAERFGFRFGSRVEWPCQRLFFVMILLFLQGDAQSWPFIGFDCFTWNSFRETSINLERVSPHPAFVSLAYPACSETNWTFSLFGSSVKISSKRFWSVFDSDGWSPSEVKVWLRV